LVGECTGVVRLDARVSAAVGHGFGSWYRRTANRKVLGHDDVAVYDASLSEWGADPTLPMERD
jgi:3-mercaptopyruvate sulfurtransferase SseA